MTLGPQRNRHENMIDWDIKQGDKTNMKTRLNKLGVWITEMIM